MKLRILPLCILGIVVLLMSSCTTSHDYYLAVTCEDFQDNPNNESEFTLEVGDKVRIELCSNPSTGHEWEYEIEDTEVIMEEDHDYDEPDSDLVGAPGTEFWTFEATNTGNTEIQMEYMPAGTGTAEDIWTLVMKITVE